jgi:prepilin-type N-terminal cleavage/methylation domain-containing protein
MKKGYTLIELMVCVAFVGIFCAIVLPFIFGKGGCHYQGRIVSRFTGQDLVLKLPPDCDKVLSFSIGRDGEKDVLYQTKDGQYKVKTYSDWGVWQPSIKFERE